MFSHAVDAPYLLGYLPIRPHRELPHKDLNFFLDRNLPNGCQAEILDLRADCSTEILRMNVACNGLLEFDPMLKVACNGLLAMSL
jgi:hypothetical protein